MYNKEVKYFFFLWRDHMEDTIIMDGKKVRDTLLKRLIKKYETLEEKLKLVVIQIGESNENQLYVKQKRKMAEVLKVDFEEIHFSIADTEAMVLEKIYELNIDIAVHGIMIQSPVPSSFSFLKLVDAIDPKKDVDCLTTKNQENISQDGKILPATVQGVLFLLENYELLPKNKRIVVLGKSRLVGTPLFRVLQKDNEVVLCDSKTVNTRELLKQADYVLIAIGKPYWLKRNMVREGAVVIDIGTTILDGKVVGDADFESLLGYTQAITPVPGGVGPLTVLSLYTNLINLYEKK